MSTESRGFGARGNRNGIGGTNGVSPNESPSALQELRQLRDNTKDADVARICRRACRRLEHMEAGWRRVARMAQEFSLVENEK